MVPRWHPNGRELFFRNNDAMMAVEVIEADSEISLGEPTELFEFTDISADLGLAETVVTGAYDVAADGRFVMIAPGEPEPAGTRIHIIQNWDEELKRLVPTN